MKKEIIIILIAVVVMLAYFFSATPDLMDDGNQYEGFAQSLAHGKLDFKSFYGFQGLSFLSVPIIWLTGSDISIIITSTILVLLSIPLAYLIGKDYYGDNPFSRKDSKDAEKAGLYFLILFLLTPYPYTTMMRGFQEAALLFFVLLILYASIHKKIWTPVIWAMGGIVKPFALVLAPLFLKNYLKPDLKYKRSNLVGLSWFIFALAIGGLYLGVNYYQTGHLVNNAAIGSYEGNFDTSNVPALSKSFIPGIKGFLRVGANLLLSFRKIMISPLVIVIGAFSLLFNRELKLRKEIIMAIFLNFLLVGSLTFSFSKYLLPMTTLFALVSVPYLQKYKWLTILIFIDSFFVFLPIWNYFGKSFWSSIYIYLIPFYLALAIYFYAIKNNNSHSNA